MVGDHYCGGPGLHGLLGPGYGHDTFYNERHLGIGDYLLHLIHGLAAGIGVHGLQEGQARSVHVHGGSKNSRLIQGVQFGKDRLLVPGLDGGAAYAANLLHIFHGGEHDAGVHAIPGEGHEPILCGHLHQNGIILLVLVLGAVVHVDGAQRGGKDGGGKLAAKELKGDVGLGVGAEGVHIHAYLLPLVKVPGSHVAGVFAAGAGHGVAAGLAVAHGAGLAVGADAVSGGGQYLVVVHVVPLLRFRYL